MAASTTISSVDSQIENYVRDVLKVSSLEESFNMVIVHNENGGNDQNTQIFFKLMSTLFTSFSAEQRESALRSYLLIVANNFDVPISQCLLEILQRMVTANILTARMVCEQLLSCERQQFENKHFWMESFRLILRLLSGVDYKGVREIMKGCRDKIQSFPQNISSNIAPQLQVVELVLERIFDRNACLLPAYFIANEIQKSVPTHWKIAALATSFVEDFRQVAQMVSMIGHSHMLPIVEHFGQHDTLINPWRLDSNTMKFSFRGILPYDTELVMPQPQLLRYVLEQPYSKDMVCGMLNLQKQHKQRCPAVEEQLVWLIMSAMERSEQEIPKNLEVDDTFSNIHWLWLHISSQLIYFVLLQFATFPNILSTLHDLLAVKGYRRGRDYLMWALLQFISGSIQRNPVSSFMSVLGLFDVLYPEKEPLPVPDCTKTYATRQMAPTCIWIHLSKKAQMEHFNLPGQLPVSLKNHFEFLQQMMTNNSPLTMGNDFIIVMLCNAYSTNPDFFTRPMNALSETINRNPTTGTPQQPLLAVPLPMITLDNLTVHAKMSLIHSIVSQIMKHAQAKNTIPGSSGISPAVVETYSRLLAYTEIESLGIKGFLGQLLPTVFKSQSWSMLHTLLEMISYRMHHILPSYRVQLLSHLHSLSSVPHTNQTQLHLCVESAALRLISGLGSAEVQPQFQRYFAEPKPSGSIISAESEELNRALILTIARSMHISGSGGDDPSNAWCKELLTVIMHQTPHSWATHTLQSFPPVLNTFFLQNNAIKENKQLLRKSVEDEYLRWSQNSNENELIAHFTAPTTPPLFLCLLFKTCLETDSINPVAYKVLERIGARALSSHLRKLCDYLVYEVATSGQHHNIKKSVDTINHLIWTYNIFTLDRMAFCLAMRTFEGSEGQVCFYIMQLLVLKSPELRTRVMEFVRENSPDHWKQNNWYDKHMAYHQKYREKFSPDDSTTQNQLPVFFGNVCLRFLPVLDIIIHRFLEVPINSVNKTLESILDHLGCLYKFHDRPISYLYNTLHYYERKLRDRPSLKRHLVAAVTQSLDDIRPPNWALSEPYQTYMKKERSETEDFSWQPDLSYYIALVRRIADTISGKNIFYLSDWRFNEFPNASAHALYVTCVELLSLPVTPTVVANNIIDVIIKAYTVIPSAELHGWINVIGLLMTALPETYWSVIYDRMHDSLVSNKMTDWTYRCSPFEMFNFKTVKEAMLEKEHVFLLAIAHSILHHSSIGQLSTLSTYITEKLKPLVLHEQQLIYVCHLFGPFMFRLDQERSRVVYEIVTKLYEMLEQVDKNLGDQPLKYMESICDLLYHIKYMFVGDMLKVESENVIRKLRPELQLRLRFIIHMNVEEIATKRTMIDKQTSAQPDPKANILSGQQIPKI